MITLMMSVARTKGEKDKRLHEIEMKIAALEGEQKELAAAVEDPAAYQPGGRATAIDRNLSALSHDLARLTAKWESVTATVRARRARVTFCLGGWQTCAARNSGELVSIASE
jgi:ABC transporter C-terminal domain